MPSKNSILIVDDNAINRKILERYLAGQGHNVSIAENGRQALDILDQEDLIWSCWI